ncbi:proton ATPase, putative [Toxoplasma gondii ME49]|uniref:Proton ATPase n=2 Tax=Toxoplasma gondii TaxID=5811 RepID=A0A125YIW0_TOXGV|nr:proton ATPase, putative [Toxoplasma gondii ME49]EPT29287.1 proton ATPase, putative [Toxoplasma gondii ME49]ESS28570.1 putative proton ATPase [Toxoplasma gondii VEG]|eukprot:XP_018636985.1 proton ATPase, putative [Toxoplasma gondii ME49]
MSIPVQDKVAADRGVLANVLCLPFEIWWSNRQARRNEYVFFLTNYDFHEDVAIRESLLALPHLEAVHKTSGDSKREGTRETARSLGTHLEAPEDKERETRKFPATLQLRHRRHYEPSPVHQVSDSHVTFLKGARPENEIHTAKYTKYSFVPLVLFYQLTRFSNFYFLCVAMLQLLPAISDSGGVPTYLIPISIIVGLSVIKEFFEDYSRHKSDEEENSKQVLVFEKGKLVEKQWREVRVGDVVKVTAGQQFPADLVLLNCAHDYGICNVETKNVDGESNVKSRFCLPKLTRIFADDSTAGTAKVRFVCEPACENLTSFSGKVILPPLPNRGGDENAERLGSSTRSTRGRSSSSGSRIPMGNSENQRERDEADTATNERVFGGSDSSYAMHVTEYSGGKNKVPRNGQIQKQDSSPRQNGEGRNLHKRCPCHSYRASRSSERDNDLPHLERASISEEEATDESGASEGSRKERQEDLEGSEGTRCDGGGLQALEIHEGGPEARQESSDTFSRNAEDPPQRRRPEEQEEIALSFNQLLLRGTSMVETKWAYGAVVYAGRQTRLMMNSRVGAVQKWSRLELNYSSHVVVMIIVQVLSVFLLSFMSIYWIETQGYRASYLDLRHYVSTIKNFGLTFGATFLVFASFVPLDLFMLWEICRFVQGLFINFDKEMYSTEAERHALSQAAQLIEEMGNVTHVYSDKTGTLTKNIMQLKCVGLGDGFEYGMDLWCDDRAAMNASDRKFQKQMRQLKREAQRRCAVSRRLSQEATSALGRLAMPRAVSSAPRSIPGDPPALTVSPGSSGSLSHCLSHCSQHSAFGADSDSVSETGMAQASPVSLSKAPSLPRSNAEERMPRESRSSRRGARESRASVEREEDANDSSSGPSTSEEMYSRCGNDEDEGQSSAPIFAGGALRSTVCHPIFLREENSFVSLDRVELARSILRSPPNVVDFARHLFLIMGICHTVLVRERRWNSREETKAPGPSALERGVSQPLLGSGGLRRDSLDDEKARKRGRGARRRGSSEQRFRRRKAGGRQGISSAAVAALSSCAGGAARLRKVSLPRLRRSHTVSVAEQMEGKAREAEGEAPVWEDAFDICPRRTEWVDEASGFAFREFDEAPPQYDASSPDELCLISACNYFGLEFAGRPSLMEVELELTSSFMVELLLGWKREVEVSRKAAGLRSPGPGAHEDRRCGYPRKDGNGSSTDFTEMTRQLIVKQLERAQRLVAGPQRRSEAPATPRFNGRAEAHPGASGRGAAEKPTEREVPDSEDHGAKKRKQESRVYPSDACGAASVGSESKEEFLGALVHARSDKRSVSKSAVPFLSFEIFDVLEFDNVRKRMSVITQGFDGRYLLLCKGADTQMMEVAARGQEKHLASINAQLHGFASSGLRTLVFGYRYLPPELYRDFHSRFTQAQQLLGEEQENAVANCIAMVERDLLVVGCSGIEDRLQDDVQGTIKDLKAAGIQVWVLTGDKLETAINIGHSTNLISETAYNAVIDATNKEAIVEQLSRHEVRELVDRQMSKKSRVERSRGVPGSSTESASLSPEPLKVEATDPSLFPGQPDGVSPQGSPPDSTLESVSSTAQRGNRCPFSGSLLNAEALSRSEKGNKERGSPCVSDRKTVGMRTRRRTPDNGRVSEEGDVSFKLTAVEAATEAVLQPSPSAPAIAGVDTKKGSKAHGKRSALALFSTKRIRGKLGELLSINSHGWSGDSSDDSSLDGTNVAHRRSGRGVPHFSGFGSDVRIREYSEFCTTVTGSALAVIMQDRLLKVKFYSLARHASTLIASRVTPKQKALLLRQNSAFNPRGTSLAIGDGANDVAMILAASVGVGISGREGLQAARAADFSIGEFRLLRKLLFVHGREALRRNCILVYVCIFRNAVMCWCTLAMNFLSGFSGLDVWNTWTKQVVSLAFTCLPVLGFVTLDRQVPHRVLLENPVLYEIIPSTLWPYYTDHRVVQAREWVNNLILDPASRSCRAVGRFLFWPFARWGNRIDLSMIYAWFQHRKKPENDRCYGTHCLLLWLAFALWVAVCQLTFTVYSVVGAWTPSVNKSHGFTSLQFDSFSHVMELGYIIIVNAVIAVLSNTWTVIEVLIHVGEIVAALLFWVVISYWKLFLNIAGAEMLHGTYVLCSLCASYYFGLTITIIACLLPLLAPLAWQMSRKPTLEQVLVEQLKSGTYKPISARRGRPEGVAYVAVESPQMRRGTGARGDEEEYKGFAFTHEPIFSVLPSLQEAYKALKKTGEGAKVLLRKTQTLIKGGEGSDAKK